jgi:hypothetical protein
VLGARRSWGDGFPVVGQNLLDAKPVAKRVYARGKSTNLVADWRG